MRTNHITVIASVVALALVSLLIGTVAARATDSPAPEPGEIANFRMSNSPYGPRVNKFPVGTSVVYVIFDYADMQGDQIRIRVDDGLDEEGRVITLHDQTKSYTESGTESIPVYYYKNGEAIAFPAGRYNTVLERGGLFAGNRIWEVNYMVFLPLILRNY